MPDELRFMESKGGLFYKSSGPYASVEDLLGFIDDMIKVMQEGGWHQDGILALKFFKEALMESWAKAR